MTVGDRRRVVAGPCPSPKISPTSFAADMVLWWFLGLLLGVGCWVWPISIQDSIGPLTSGLLICLVEVVDRIYCGVSIVCIYGVAMVIISPCHSK